MPIPYMTPSEDKAAHRAVVEYMVLDRDMSYGSDDQVDYAMRRMPELAHEVAITFGAGALDYTAEYCTGHKMTPDEIILWAATEWHDVKRVLSGERIH